MKFKNNPSSWFFIIAASIVLAGLAVSIWMVLDPGKASYPDLISNAYDVGWHSLVVPGSKEIVLDRSGAYGIYYEYDPTLTDGNLANTLSSNLICTLTSTSQDTEVLAAPDFVKTNMYWKKDRETVGVLIMSMRVEQPGTYIFDCQFKDERQIPDVVVTLGPNYVWEFFKVAGKMGISVFGSVCVFCGSFLLGLMVFVIGLVKRRGEIKARSS